MRSQLRQLVSTQPNINYVQIGNNYIPLPPIDEQRQIVEAIEERLSQIRSVQTVLQPQIDVLLGYRKSLIHECVTDKRRITDEDVRRVQRKVDTAIDELAESVV